MAKAIVPTYHIFAVVTVWSKKLKVELLMLCWLNFISINWCICGFWLHKCCTFKLCLWMFCGRICNSYATPCNFQYLEYKNAWVWRKKLKSKQRGSEFFVTVILLGSAIPNESSVAVWNLDLILGIRGYLINIRIENAIKYKWSLKFFVPPRGW